MNRSHILTYIFNLPKQQLNLLMRMFFDLHFFSDFNFNSISFSSQFYLASPFSVSPFHLILPTSWMGLSNFKECFKFGTFRMHKMEKHWIVVLQWEQILFSDPRIFFSIYPVDKKPAPTDACVFMSLFHEIRAFLQRLFFLPFDQL